MNRSNYQLEPVTSVSNTQLEQVFSDDTYQLTGMAVSKDGRVFTYYPL
ncbi:hypothetical protein ACFPQ1_29640 [Rhodocytophaga aerolata]